MSHNPKRLLLFKVLVKGVVIDEAWVPEEDPDVVAMRQAILCEAALANGDDFEVEVFDPDLPPEYATMRMGTDKTRMRHPTLIEGRDVEEASMADYKRRLAAAGLLESE